MSLVKKYNVAGPRYTSYPTVPYWDTEKFRVKAWKKSLIKSIDESNEEQGISLYIHLPFCEQMCTFCGCHKHITQRHDDVETPYIHALLKEWKIYLSFFKETPQLKELHIGGGTPTFFAPERLSFFIDQLLSTVRIADKPSFSIEGHPNNTSYEHMEVLYNRGFKRISFGVQDYDEYVQQKINRVQSFEEVKSVTDDARKIGYTSICHDLVYGLPFQNLDGFTDSIKKTILLKPDRIALYSYAHVPWIKGLGQRGFSEEDLPSPKEKLMMSEKAKEMLLEIGYHSIGMDHYAQETDSLYKSYQSNSIHRNFMGYNSSKTQLMIGLGVSSIIDSWYSFAQNTKNLNEYYSLITKGEIPVVKGHHLSPEDLIRRKHILNLMCQFETSWSHKGSFSSIINEIIVKLDEMRKDGLIKLTNNSIHITAKGRPFVRNVCMAFDYYLNQFYKKNDKIFSKTI
ncbi:MAG: oxygen-independent coproporphyrinogen III oxidase [Flavobacteriales bacterium]|nr:oxygen-independent coproporphyrinogen III oxidase [Flavobacteriales bacterium]MBL6873317.1 oxygen-independent coproporphyrinogen III oxidase [Flavobacteriales bacterium]